MNPGLMGSGRYYRGVRRTVADGLNFVLAAFGDLIRVVGRNLAPLEPCGGARYPQAASLPQERRWRHGRIGTICAFVCDIILHQMRRLA